MSADDLEALEKKVALMRKLGITECEGIKLGPPIPPQAKEETADEFEKRINAEVNEAARRRHEIMFAASSTRPKLRVLK